MHDSTLKWENDGKPLEQWMIKSVLGVLQLTSSIIRNNMMTPLAPDPSNLSPRNMLKHAKPTGRIEQVAILAL